MAPGDGGQSMKGPVIMPGGRVEEIDSAGTLGAPRNPIITRWVLYASAFQPGDVLTLDDGKEITLVSLRFYRPGDNIVIQWTDSHAKKWNEIELGQRVRDIKRAC